MVSLLAYRAYLLYASYMDLTDYSTEIWKPIDAAPSYAVSNFGRVSRISGGQGARPMLRQPDLERT
ncbi:MAG: hypothetical protein EBT84_12890, partial [Sphingomonadaceae bacterium]|nr:hypothetical protein [Sphingomonadaceae bacterium]